MQRPGPPIILGGMSRAAMERAGRMADGWMTSSRADLSRIRDNIKVVRTAAAGAGRDPEEIRIVCRGVVRAGQETRSPRPASDSCCPAATSRSARIPRGSASRV